MKEKRGGEMGKETKGRRGKKGKGGGGNGGTLCSCDLSLGKTLLCIARCAGA